MNEFKEGDFVWVSGCSGMGYLKSIKEGVAEVYYTKGFTRVTNVSNLIAVRRDYEKIPQELLDYANEQEEEKIYNESFKKQDDPVNHPSHYTSDPSGVECIDVVKYRDFCIGNAIKYLWRAGLKHDADKSDKEKEIEDLKKAEWYICKKIDMLESNSI